VNTLFGKKVRIINIYAPNVNGTRVSVARYKEFLAKLSMVLDTRMPTILGGDVNLIMDPQLDAEKPNASSHFPELVTEWKKLLDEVRNG
jgi:exonuclease III